MDIPPKKLCGAKNRQGEPCKKPPIRGKNRCLNHGGKTPKGVNAGKTNNKHRHGLYSAALVVHPASWLVFLSLPRAERPQVFPHLRAAT
jgi:hypothetical protein